MFQKKFYRLLCLAKFKLKMADFNFVIPSTIEELLVETIEHYYVQNLVEVKEVPSKLQDVEQSFKDEGPEFIIKTFDSFYSIILQSADLHINLVTRAQEILLQSVQDLKKVIAIALENIEILDDKTKLKHQNIIKMLLFIFVNINIAIEAKIEKSRSQNINLVLGKRTMSPDGDAFASVNRTLVVLSIHDIFQEQIDNFWNLLINDSFVSMAIKMCYQYLALPFIITEEELQSEVFDFIGTLINHYNYSTIFSHEIVQLINVCEHLTLIIPECIRFLVENYNCKRIVREVVIELKKFQPKNFNDCQGYKCCTLVLMEMTKLMPSLMIRETIDLNLYFADSNVSRNSHLNVNALSKDNLTREERHRLNNYLSFMKENFDNATVQVRLNLLRHWTQLITKILLPVYEQNSILRKAIGFLRDEFTDVQTSAAYCVTAFVALNFFADDLHSWKVQLKLELKPELNEVMTLQQELNIFVEDCEPLHSKKLLAEINECEQLILSLKDQHDWIDNGLEFLKLIDNAIEPMKDLIASPCVYAMQEAIIFFLMAYQFNVDNASDGFSVMLKLMHSNDQLRKDAVMEAFKTMYLTTKSSMSDRPSIVVRNLINLTKSIENLYDLKLIISQAVAKGIIDNDIIDLLWDFFTKKSDVSDNDSIYAVCLLSMAAVGRRTIITRNIKLVARIGFGERGQRNLLLVQAVCTFLTLAKSKKIKLEDSLWANLIQILINNFHVKRPLYLSTISTAVHFIYTMCSKPDLLCKDFIERVSVTLQNAPNIEPYIIVHCNIILGKIVLEHLRFLKLLKLRNNINNTKNQNNGNRNVGNVYSASDSVARKSSTAVSSADDITLIGTQVEDFDPEFISNVLKKCTIFSHCFDRPNFFLHVVKFWARAVYWTLQDSVFEVRYTAFLVLAYLILNDMLCPYKYFLGMAKCLVDTEKPLRDLSEQFFTQLSLKDQHFCNVLPDICWRFFDLIDLQENDLHIIMKFLISLIEETEQNDYLVDRLWLKFQSNLHNGRYGYFAYWMSLITYNEKGLTKLLQHFQSDKNHLHQPEVLAIFEQILNNFIGSRNYEINTLAKEIKEKINTVFSFDHKAETEVDILQATGAIKKSKEFLMTKKRMKETSTKCYYYAYGAAKYCELFCSSSSCSSSSSSTASSSALTLPRST